MLPGMSGLEVCRALRAEPATAAIPIIMVTARAEETDRIIGLEIGADDYIAKPFSPNELVARIRALMRRSKRSEPESATLTFGSLVMDLERAHGRRRRAGGEADRQGVPAAAVPAAAPRPRAVARSAARRRLGIPLHRAARERWTSTCAGCARSCRCWSMRSSP